MSFDALAWAAKQNTGSSGTKLILLGLAECADRSHALAFPSVAALVEFSSLDRKSVIANLDKLEQSGFITDTGRRAGRTGQIKVYQLNLERVPESEQFQNRNSSVFPAKGPKNGTRNQSEPVNTEGSNEPSCARGKHLLPKGWKAPPVAELTPKAREYAEQWTRESYEAVAEAFVLYWTTRRKMMADWHGTWCGWVLREHSKVMRDQKFNNSAPAARGRADRPMTREEIHSAIRFNEDRGDRAKADEYRRKLDSMGPDPPLPFKVRPGSKFQARMGTNG